MQSSFDGAQIVQFFERHPLSMATIRQLAKQTGTSYGTAHTRVTALAKQGILTTNKVGNAVICTINLKNTRAQVLLAVASIIRSAEHAPISPSVLHHLEEDCIIACIHNNTILALMRQNTTVTVAANLPVRRSTLQEIAQATGEGGMLVVGAETFWRRIGERQ